MKNLQTVHQAAIIHSKLSLSASSKAAWCDAAADGTTSKPNIPSKPDSAPSMPSEVTFLMQIETQWGDTAILVGSTPELGEWQTDHGVKMTTDTGTYPCWQAQLQLHGDAEYKLVIMRGSGAVEWEGLHHNRLVTLGEVGQTKNIRIQGSWNDPHVERMEAVLDVSPTPLTGHVMMGNEKRSAVQQRSPFSISATLQPPEHGMAQQPAQATEYPIFYRAPRPNRSFTVVGGQGAQPISACPPTSWPPPVAPLVAVATPEANAVQTLSPIESLDMSWPPSCGSSFKSSYSQGPGSGVGSFNRSRSMGSFSSRSSRSALARGSHDSESSEDSGHHQVDDRSAATGDSVLGRANLGKIQ